MRRAYRTHTYTTHTPPPTHTHFISNRQVLSYSRKKNKKQKRKQKQKTKTKNKQTKNDVSDTSLTIVINIIFILKCRIFHKKEPVVTNIVQFQIMDFSGILFINRKRGGGD